MGTILALDLGTTGNRCLAINSSGTIIAQHYQEFTQFYPKSSWVEHDANDIWASIYTCIQNVINTIEPSDILGISLTNQRETSVAWNKTTGEVLGPAIVWQCRRTADFCKHHQDQSDWIRSKTGLPLDAYFSATKFAWLLDNHSDAHLLANKEELCLGTIDSWIIYKLTQGQQFVTDASNASRTLLYNIHTHRWDDELCEFFSVQTHCLPSVLASDGSFGQCTLPDLNLDVPILSVLGDQQAALFAQCGSNPNLIKNTYGTGLFLMTCTGKTPIQDNRLLSTVAWQIGNKTHYALEGSVFIGGSAIQWCRDELGILESAADSETLARSLNSNDDVYFVPALSGLGAPYWDSYARGTIIGLTRGTGKAHIARAALESIAYQTADVFNVMESLQGHAFSELRVDGGASTNSFLMQFQADLLNRRISKPSLTESTAFGVAALGFISLGIWTEESFRSLIELEQDYTPSPSDSYKNDYKKWQEAVKRAQSWSN